jgi:hypothetical protein
MGAQSRRGLNDPKGVPWLVNIAVAIAPTRH